MAPDLTWLFIVDASVVLRAFLKTSRAAEDRISDLFKQAKTHKTTIMVPDFFWTEVSNALRFSVDTPSEVEEFILLIHKQPLSTFQVSKAMQMVASRVSREYGTTVYDTIYHLMALHTNSTFLTADKKYFQATKSLGHIELIS